MFANALYAHFYDWPNFDGFCNPFPLSFILEETLQIFLVLDIVLLKQTVKFLQNWRLFNPL